MAHIFWKCEMLASGLWGWLFMSCINTKNILSSLNCCRLFTIQFINKVKWSRYRPGVAQRVGKGVALLFHDRGTRRGWVVCSTPRMHFTTRHCRFRDNWRYFTEISVNQSEMPTVMIFKHGNRNDHCHTGKVIKTVQHIQQQAATFLCTWYQDTLHGVACQVA